MKKDKTKKSKFIEIFALVVIIVSIFMITDIYNEEIKNTNAEPLSNKKIGWGIKRNDNHEQPDVGSANKNVLEQYNGIALGSKILEILKNNQVKATFFITAHYVNTQEELVKQMIEEGHIVGNHTVNHKSMPDLSEEKIKKEILELHQTIYDKFNYEMKYMRPPKGEFSEKSLSVTNSLGYKTVMWSFAYEDWNEDKQPEEEKSKAKILNNLHNGEIMLLHGNSKTNTNILDSIIKEAKQMGYEFKSLDEFQN